MTKYDWKKEEKEQYGAKDMPVFLDVPRWNFLIIRGTGDPNHVDFSERVSVLYSLAYPIKMKYKSQYGLDYAVYPLEGVWSTTNPADLSDKNAFAYALMIRQPDFITKEMFSTARETVKKKKPHPLLAEVAFDAWKDGRCVQMLHVGSYDDEPETFAQMDRFVQENGLARAAASHREIYLSDARKTAPERRKTLLRYRVE